MTGMKTDVMRRKTRWRQIMQRDEMLVLNGREEERKEKKV